MVHPTPRSILFVITSLEPGGAQENLLAKLRGIDRGRFRPSLLVLTEDRERREQFLQLGIPIYSARLWRKLPTPLAFHRLVRVLQQVKADLISATLVPACFATQLAARVAGCTAPIVWEILNTLYSFQDENVLGRLAIRGCRRMSGLPARIVYVSNIGRTQFERLGFDARQSQTIPLGTDLNRFKPSAEARARVRRELDVGVDEVLIGLLARYHPIKDHPTFVRAAAIVAAQRPGTRFLLAGSGAGSSNAELAELIRTQAGPAAGKFHLLGIRSDWPDLYSGMELHCLTSSMSESFPLVIGEAMATQTPCVVTDVGDSALIVGDTGRVVPPRDPEAFAARLIELIDLGPRGREELGRAARKRIEERFSLAKMLAAFEALYEDCVAGRPRQTDPERWNR